MPFDRLTEELTGRGAGVAFGMALGAATTGFVAWWRRRQEKLSVLKGDARDSVAINLHVVEPTPDGTAPATLRIRTLGQAEVARVVPNGHLAAVLLDRAFEVSPRNTLISMAGAEGSFLLETLTNFVCDRTSGAPFERDLYVMAPCCEPAAFAEHQPITILLVRAQDLPLFERWPNCRDVRVEHGSDGSRVLTLWELAQRSRHEQDELARLRAAGQRTQHVETMYVLDLALDRRTVPIPVQPVRWERFKAALDGMKPQ